MEKSISKMKELGIDQLKFDTELKGYAKRSGMPDFLISERALELAGKLKPGERVDIGSVLNSATKDLIKASQSVKQAEPVPDKGLETKAVIEKKNQLEVARVSAEQQRLLNIIAGAGAEKNKSASMTFGR